MAGKMAQNGTDKFPDLSDDVKRSISSTFWIFDEMLCRFEEFADGREVHSVLYHERNRLSPHQRIELLEAVKQMRGIVLELKETMGLEERVEDAASCIVGHSTAVWSYLEDTKSKRLKRYGQLPVGLADYLDPRVEAIIGHIRRLWKIFEKKAEMR